MQWKKASKLADAYNINDLRDVTQHNLPYPVFHFLDGGTEDETSLRENTRAFERDWLVPRYLVDVKDVDTSVQVLGRKIEWPVFCSPTGCQRLWHEDGELAAARAAAKAGTYYGLSTASTYSLEDVAAVSNGPKMFQLYIYKNRDFTRAQIERCRKAGYTALCLTVDTPVPGRFERDLRTGWGSGWDAKVRLSTRFVLSFLGHPRWLLGMARKGQISLPNVAAESGSSAMKAQLAWMGSQVEPSVTWKDLREFIEQWGGPFAIKGILAADDARRAADVGATAVMLSNHGGRQLDSAAAPFHVLPDVARAVGDRLEVILDGGIRRGTHVMKALARGARACSVGRAYLYGLAAGGEAGASKALEMLRSEFVRTMKLTGVRSISEIDDRLVRSVAEGGPAPHDSAA